MAEMEPGAVTRERLLAAAAEEFLQVGYAGASLAKIAARIGHTKGSLAYHFPTKESLLSALVLHAIEADEVCASRTGKTFPHQPSRALIGYIATFSFLSSLNPITAAAGTMPVDPSIPIDYARKCHLVWKRRMTSYFEGVLQEGYEVPVSPGDAARRLLTTTSGDQIISRFYEETRERPRISQLEPCLVSLGIYDAAQAVEEVKNAEFFYETGLK